MIARLFQWLRLPPGIWETLMVGSICALALLPYLSVERMEVHFDEGEWISTSYYLEEFVSGDFRSPVWNVNYWTQTQPPVTCYILGLGRLAAGFTRADLNPARVEGGEQVLNMPNLGLLRASRITMSLFTAAAAAMLFTLLGTAFGRFSAYPFAILWGASAYLPRVGARAMGDAPLLFFTILTVWSVFHAAQNPTGNLKKSWGWLAAAGLLGGLAAATKLNGGLVVMGGILVVALAALTSPHLSDPGRRRTVAIRSGLIITFTAGLIFIALNPYLYPDPLFRVGKMLRYRAEETRIFVDVFTQDRITTFMDRILVVPQRVFETYAGVRFKGALWVNLPLALLGLARFTVDSWRWLRRRTGSPAGLCLLGMLGLMSLPGLMTPLDWDRYYLMLVVLGMLAEAAALGGLLNWIGGRWILRRGGEMI